MNYSDWFRALCALMGFSIGLLVWLWLFNRR